MKKEKSKPKMTIIIGLFVCVFTILLGIMLFSDYSSKAARLALERKDYQGLEKTTKLSCFQNPISQIIKDFTDAIFDRSPNSTLLELACRSEDAQAVEILLKNGANPNFSHSFRRHYSLIDAAIARGNPQILDLLLKYGAVLQNPTYRTPFYNYLSTHQEIWDSQETDTLVKIVSILKENGMFSDEQYADLVYAAAACANREVTLYLWFENISSVSWLDEDGKTMLHIVCERGASSNPTNLEYIQLLIEQGIDVSAKDLYGKTAYDYAGERGESEIMELLAAHMT